MQYIRSRQCSIQHANTWSHSHWYLYDYPFYISYPTLSSLVYFLSTFPISPSGTYSPLSATVSPISPSSPALQVPSHRHLPSPPASVSYFRPSTSSPGIVYPSCSPPLPSIIPLTLILVRGSCGVLVVLQSLKKALKENILFAIKASLSPNLVLQLVLKTVSLLQKKNSWAHVGYESASFIPTIYYAKKHRQGFTKNM